ncbi:MAG: hypothetical protein WA058_03270 [Minisyncoccia bacterium]
MSYVIAARGQQTVKIVGKETKKVIPFVGADNEGEFAQMGVGLIFPDEARAIIWSLASPHNVIQSWRGMKILEKLGRVGHGTLCACWTVARHDLHESDRRYFDMLVEQVGSIEELSAIRDAALGSVPSPDELNDMIVNFREKGVYVGSREFEEEIKAGRIAMTPLIEVLIRERKELMEKYKEEDELRRMSQSRSSLRQSLLGRFMALFQ